ncbi:hypothetical protein ACRRTK_024707 [Alexandromys fortis]
MPQTTGYSDDGDARAASHRSPKGDSIRRPARRAYTPLSVNENRTSVMVCNVWRLVFSCGDKANTLRRADIASYQVPCYRFLQFTEAELVLNSCLLLDWKPDAAALAAVPGHSGLCVIPGTLSQQLRNRSPERMHLLGCTRERQTTELDDVSARNKDVRKVTCIGRSTACRRNSTKDGMRQLGDRFLTLYNHDALLCGLEKGEEGSWDMDSQVSGQEDEFPSTSLLTFPPGQPSTKTKRIRFHTGVSNPPLLPSTVVLLALVGVDCTKDVLLYSTLFEAGFDSPDFSFNFLTIPAFADTVWRASPDVLFLPVVISLCAAFHDGKTLTSAVMSMTVLTVSSE